MKALLTKAYINNVVLYTGGVAKSINVQPLVTVLRRKQQLKITK